MGNYFRKNSGGKTDLQRGKSANLKNQEKNRSSSPRAKLQTRGLDVYGKYEGIVSISIDTLRPMLGVNH